MRSCDIIDQVPVSLQKAISEKKLLFLLIKVVIVID